jgi:hypothetical protein
MSAQSEEFWRNCGYLRHLHALSYSCIQPQFCQTKKLTQRSFRLNLSTSHGNIHTKNDPAQHPIARGNPGDRDQHGSPPSIFSRVYRHCRKPAGLRIPHLGRFAPGDASDVGRPAKWRNCHGPRCKLPAVGRRREIFSYRSSFVQSRKRVGNCQSAAGLGLCPCHKYSRDAPDS